MLKLIAGMSPWASVAAYAVIVAALGVGYGVWHHKVYQRGYDDAIAGIVANNKEAVDAADDVRTRVRDCNARDGMRWDQIASECVRRAR